MSDRIVQIVTFAAALGAGIMGGLFFIFSNTIMASFAKLPPAQGIAAMNSINVTILNGTFLSIFMGTALLSVALIAGWFLGWIPSGGLFTVAAALVYLVGIIGVTMIFNVPMNDTLATMQADTTQGVELWQDYLTRWTLWNHVRTVAGIASMALFILAYRG